jgi:hypothetical protein
MIAKEFN